MPGQSRYRSVPPDELRPIRPAEGTVRHIVRQGDRLDHLAATYYGDPPAWWRICDANPEPSPLALLGDGPHLTTFLPLAVPAGTDLAPLLRALAADPGVRLAVPVEGGVEVVHNVLVTAVPAVAAAVRAAGFTPGPPQDRGPVGSAIVIPPAGGA